MQTIEASAPYRHRVAGPQAGGCQEQQVAEALSPAKARDIEAADHQATKAHQNKAGLADRNEPFLERDRCQAGDDQRRDAVSQHAGMSDRRKRHASADQQRHGSSRTDHYRDEARPSQTAERKAAAQDDRQQHHAGNGESQSGQVKCRQGGADPDAHHHQPTGPDCDRGNGTGGTDRELPRTRRIFDQVRIGIAIVVNAHRSTFRMMTVG